MITRKNIAEQLREYQLRSSNHWASVHFFSSTSDLLSSRYETARGTLYLLLFCKLVLSAVIAFYCGYAKASWLFVGLALGLLLFLSFINSRRRRKNPTMLPL